MQKKLDEQIKNDEFTLGKFGLSSKLNFNFGIIDVEENIQEE